MRTSDNGAAAGGAIHPAWIAVFFALMAAIAMFSAPENLVASAASFFCLAIAAANPVNGVAFLFMSAPFFLGAANMPYFWLYDLFLYGALLAWPANSLIRRDGITVPLASPLALVALAAIFSFPVNIKELYLSLWATPPGEQAYLWLIGYGGAQIVYLRFLLNLLSGALLFMAVADMCCKGGAARAETVLRGAALMAAPVLVAGVAMFYGLIDKDPQTWHYLSLSLVGQSNGAITAFSYNPQYLVQWLMPLIPPILYLMWKDAKRPVWAACHAATLALIVFTLLQGGQRSAVIATGAITLALPGYFIWRRSARLWPVALYAAMAAALAILASAWVLAGSLGEGRSILAIVKGIKGYVDDPLYFMRHGILEPRFFLWHTAARMLAFSPFLGVGLGRYHLLFFHFYNSEWRIWEDIGFATGTAHSLYLQTLAEQGLLGFAAWAVFTWFVFRAARVAAGDEARRLALVLCASLVLWLALGLIHNIAHVRAMGVSYWLFAGMIAGLAQTGGGRMPTLSSRAFRLAVLALLVALASHVHAASQWQVRDGFTEGFHGWEKTSNGKLARWMGKRGVLSVRPERDKVALPVAAPLPGLDRRPQRLAIWIDGEKTEVTLDDTSWRLVTIPVSGGAAGSKILWLEAEYVFNPRREGISGDERDLGVMVGAPGDKWPDARRISIERAGQ